MNLNKLSNQAIKMLNYLTNCGIYGSTSEEVAVRSIEAQLAVLVREGIISLPRQKLNAPPPFIPPIRK